MGRDEVLYSPASQTNKKEELTQGIRDFWSTVTPDMCTRYINRIAKDAELIVANDGGPAGH